MGEMKRKKHRAIGNNRHSIGTRVGCSDTSICSIVHHMQNYRVFILNRSNRCSFLKRVVVVGFLVI